MRTGELLSALREHYRVASKGHNEGGLFVDEVGTNGASKNNRRCDAIHVGFTSASGRIMRGHEIKVSRSDWLNELKKDKASQWADACHEWYLVVPDTGIIKEGELPHGWGLMTPRKGAKRFKVHVRPEFHDVTPPWWAVRSIMARSNTLKEEEAERRISSEVNRQVEALRKSQRNWETMSRRDRMRLEAAENYFDVTGVELGFSWDKGTAEALRLSEFLKAARDADEAERKLAFLRQNIANVRDSAQRILRATKDL